MLSTQLLTIDVGSDRIILRVVKVQVCLTILHAKDYRQMLTSEEREVDFHECCPRHIVQCLPSHAGSNPLSEPDQMLPGKHPEIANVHQTRKEAPRVFSYQSISMAF